jgi:predicted transcriptional regulator
MDVDAFALPIDDETLAAIDKGIHDADAGRTVPMEEVRRLLPKWIIAPSSRHKLWFVL